MVRVSQIIDFYSFSVDERESLCLEACISVHFIAYTAYPAMRGSIIMIEHSGQNQAIFSEHPVPPDYHTIHIIKLTQ